MSDSSTAKIRPVHLADALGERYLSYALSTITARSLPDVRDGLKPVHRRLLFAMRQLRLGAGGAPKKSARVVGDVIGKFHPHGDQSVYDALVRLAQDFAVRYPLVDGQGNYGNIDGDSAAAMRYTEARLTDYAEALLDGIDEDTVDLRETYDGEGSEPVVLPAAVPNLLANGSQGIAVGMATSIPPHNLGEIFAALRLLIRKPDASLAEIIARMPGPDFPTGGVLVEAPEAIQAAYRTGRGSFRLRARWEIEKLPQGQYQLVVTEIPYQVGKSKLVERVAELITAKKLPILADIRDESASDVRIVLEPKSRNVDPEMLMEHLFKMSDLEVRASLNMNVLEGGLLPRVMPLPDVLRAFLDHRRDVLGRRSRFRLGKIEERLEVLRGYLVAYANLDEVIQIIREADDARGALMDRFGITTAQADAILNMRLRALRRLDEIEIRTEFEALENERLEIQALLDDEALQWRHIDNALKALDKQFGAKTELGRRRTTIEARSDTVVVPMEALVEREPITVFVSQQGWIRAVRGHLSDTSEVRYKEGDAERLVLHAETTDKLLIFANNGRFYTLQGDKIPRGRGLGDPLRLMVDISNETQVHSLRVHRPEGILVLAASDGRGFQVAEADCLAQTRAGRQVMTPGGGATAQVCLPVAEDVDTIAVVGTNRKLLCFPLHDLPQLTKGRGVILQRYRDAQLSDLTLFRAEAGLSWAMGSRTRTETGLIVAVRGGAGQMVPRGFPPNNRFA